MAAIASAQGTCAELSNCVAPHARPGGLAFDGELLWMGSMGAGVLEIAQIDPSACALVRTIPAPGLSLGGLAWDGSALWCLPEESGQLYRVDPSDGTVLHVIPAPSFGLANPSGADLAWDGTALWHVDYGMDTLFCIDPADGTVLAAFPTPGPLPIGLTWSPDGLVLGDAAQRRLYLVDPSDGSVLRWCPVTESFPYGLALGAQAEVWYGGVSSNRLRSHDLGLTPAAPWYTSYCSAAPNSTGEPALLSAEGSPSLAAGDLELVARPVPTKALGVFFYGSSAREHVFGRGRLCVGGRLWRLGCATWPVADELRRAVDYDRLPRRGTIQPGSTWYFQAWYLDRRSRWPRFNFTDGLEIVFAP